MKKILLYITGVSLGASLLSGCNPAAVFKPDSEVFIEEGWRRHPCKDKKPQALYCYNTLGNKACYTSPLPEGDRRLAGYYGAKP